jgi:hypothetical protein
MPDHDLVRVGRSTQAQKAGRKPGSRAPRGETI